MSDEFDELLADSDGEETEAEEAEVDNNRPNKAIKQLRDALKRKEREASRFEKELEELRSFKSQVEQEKKTTTLAGAGLNDKQAKAFLKMYDDVTPDAIREFRTDILGQQVEGESDTPAQEFTPTAGQTEPSSRTYTKAEFEAIMRENQAKGFQILNSGKVKF